MGIRAGKHVLTLEMKINFLTAVRDGKVVAQACPLHRGKTTTVWEARIHDESGPPVAAALLTLVRLGPGRAGGD